jgi:hypothetical protein
MNVEEFCDKLRSIRDKNCEVFISHYCDKELEKQNRHLLWIKEYAIRCDNLALFITWAELKRKVYIEEAEVKEEENSIILRLDNLTYKISVFVPAKLEDILD